MHRSHLALVGSAFLTASSLLVLAPGCGRTTLLVPSDSGTFDGGRPDTGPPPPRCTTDRECDDGIFCNGREQCAAGACVGTTPPRCDDGIACTVDVCSPMIDTCVATPDSTRCRDGELCLPDEGGCVVRPCAGDAECDNGNACDGMERCIAGTCRASMPILCDDADECTDDSCDPMAGCLHFLRDRDTDGFIDIACGGDDCDDASPIISPAAPEVCGSGLDENCNGLVDCDDARCVMEPECACAPMEACGEGRDADCDMLIDCADPECVGTPACVLPCMPRELGSAIGPAVATGTTTGGPNDVRPSCASSNAPEHVYRWTAPEAGLFTFDTVGSRYDTMLVLLAGCTGPELACNDDTPGVGVSSRITRMFAAGDVVLVVVDGFSMQSGAYTLNITRGATGVEVCTNRVDDDGDGLVDCSDPDCAVSPVCCRPRPEVCTNTVDDDCDRQIDCGDSDCRMSPACCIPTVEACADGSDQDCDMLVDCADPDCGSAPECCVAMPESCGNMRDDDCDSRVDCMDPDCAASPSCCIASPEVCSGGRDEDCDRRIDCADADCAASPLCCVPVPEVCDDGTDDDCDARIDCADPDCAASPACCMPTAESCANGRDDDCDRRVDCADSDCGSAPECCVATPEVCGDGTDEDCDALVDCADPDCAGVPLCCVPVAELCSNGRDDDCDMQVDCADPSCAAVPPCAPACPDRDLGSRLGLRVTTGTTLGAPNRFTPSCVPGSTAGERAFTWTAPVTGEYLFDTIGSSYDTVLTLRESCTGPELAGMCNDDIPGLGQASRLRTTLMAGTRILIVIDGFGGSSGAFVLSIVRAFPDETGLCSDALDNDGDGPIDCGDPDCAMDTACLPMP